MERLVGFQETSRAIPPDFLFILIPKNIIYKKRAVESVY